MPRRQRHDFFAQLCLCDIAVCFARHDFFPTMTFATLLSVVAIVVDNKNKSNNNNLDNVHSAGTPKLGENIVHIKNSDCRSSRLVLRVRLVNTLIYIVVDLK